MILRFWCKLAQKFDNLSFVFSSPESHLIKILEIIMEISFALDILLRFIHQQRDIETMEIIADVRKIAKRYLL
jgi:hypothetical protein